MPPSRRQSFAPMSSAESFRPGAAKKRALSFAPGEAARQLAPRKSILKNSQFTFSVPFPSQQQGSSQGQSHDASGMENQPNEYMAQISDKTSRKSFGGRRVSFAEMAFFRIFNDDNTNSTSGPSSSPSVASPVVTEQYAPPLQAPQLSNENDYPGRRQNNQPYPRLSSVTDYGERSMSIEIDDDDTQQMQLDSDFSSEPPTDPVFFSDTPNEGGVVAKYGIPSDDDDTNEDDDDGEMEVTEAIALNINRKHSISVAKQNEIARRTSFVPKRRSSVKFAGEIEEDPEEEEDEESRRSRRASRKRTSSAPKDFTIALGQPLKEPEPPSDAWLALAAMASSVAKKDGTEGGAENEEMELDNALTRLRNARASFDLRDDTREDSPLSGEPAEELSFTESSFDDSMDMGDRTLNVTNLMGRVSTLEIAGDDTESNPGSVGDDDFAQPIPHGSLGETAPLNITWKSQSGSIQEAQPTTSTFGPSGVDVSEPLSTEREDEPANVDANQDEGETANETPQQQPFRPRVFSAPTSAPPSRIPVLSPSKSGTPSRVTPSKKRPAPAFSVYVDPRTSPAKKRHIDDESSVAPLSQSQRINKPSVLTDLTSRPTDKPSESTPSVAPTLRTSLGGGARRFSGFSFRRQSLASGTTQQSSKPPPPSDQQGNSLERRHPQEQLGTSLSAQRKDKDPVHDENTPIMPRPESRVTFEKLPTSESAASVEVPSVIITDDTPAGKEPMSIMDMDVDHDQPLRPRLSTVLETQSFEENDFEEDLPLISIKEFFLMTGVKFMGDLTAPRRSTIHPSQLNRRESATMTIPTMAEYVMAMNVHFPQLELYSWVAKDLQLFIDNSKRLYEEAEEEVAKLTPSLFREFSQANDEGREELLHQLKLIKANRHSAAKEKWYEWKYQWIQNLLANVDRGFSDLEKDKITLTNFIDQAEDILPALRQQHAQTLAELERERREVEEIENSETSFLEELKGTIEEQNILLNDYKTDAAESNAKLARLEEKLRELQIQKEENETAIAQAEKRIALNKTSLTTEVFKLKDELESLQIMHNWRISKIEKHYVNLVYSELFLVHVPCIKFRPLCAEISISRLNVENPQASKKGDRFPSFSSLVVRQAQKLAQNLSASSLKKVLAVLSDYWSSCAQLRAQLKFLAIKYPISVETSPQDSSNYSLRVKVPILLRNRKSKIFVEFGFDEETIARWPIALAKLTCDVRTAYGDVNADEVQTALRQRLSECNAANSHACLLDSCVEAISQFE